MSCEKAPAVAQQRAYVASQLDVLKATDAQVEAALSDLQANVASRAAELRAAKAVADGAVARLAQARANEAAKQAEVDALSAQLHSYALDAFVQRTGGTFSDVVFNDSAANVTDLAVGQAYTRLASGHNADISEQTSNPLGAPLPTRERSPSRPRSSSQSSKQEQALFARSDRRENHSRKSRRTSKPASTCPLREL